jgi:hypothetical protein
MNYQNEKVIPWEMGKRWAYSTNHIFYDPKNEVKQLLQEKVPLAPEERKCLLMSGIALSDWYINELTDLWINRGSICSAHYMINEGINQFYTALFSLNNQLVADYKWRYFCAERLPLLPSGFSDKMPRVMQTTDLSKNDLNIRKTVFMELWRDILPLIEAELEMKYADFKNLI